MAAQHIPAYVNECKMEDTPTVHAEHDPEGVVHYLLGVPKKHLILPTDGTSSELFINYGPAYERIRIRKNYSFLPPSKQLEQVKSIAQENAEFLEELGTFQDVEVTSCIKFVTDMVLGTDKLLLPGEFVPRALCVALALRHRGLLLLENIRRESPWSTNLRHVVEQFNVVVKTLLEHRNDAGLSQLHESGDHASFFSEAAKPLLQGLEPNEIQRTLSVFLPRSRPDEAT
jgi:hypothetical protein